MIGEKRIIQNKCAQCHFMYHVSHVFNPGIEPGVGRLESKSLSRTVLYSYFFLFVTLHRYHKRYTVFPSFIACNDAPRC